MQSEGRPVDETGRPSLIACPGMLTMDTIYALSSGAPPSGVAVIRLSGPGCAGALGSLCGAVPAPREATLRVLRNAGGMVIDKALVLYFAGPASFTGEDCAELQVHGGRAVVEAVLETLSRLKGLRHADAGEFSRRAFLNGKLDLVELEGLADLISAETEMQRRLALEHAEGGQSRVYQDWTRRLTHARAMIEAELDFADEDDVPGSVASTVWADVAAIRGEVSDHLSRAGVGEIIRDGFRIVISGPPNSGKSSLINILSKREVAIVTDIAGTTRDVIAVDLNIDGYAVKLYDTAGLREATEIVEAEGIRRARALMKDANLILALIDGTDKNARYEADAAVSAKTIRIRTKSDLPGFISADDGSLSISTRDGTGVDTLLSRVRLQLREMTSPSSSGIPSRRRHAQHLRGTFDSLTECLLVPEGQIEIRAEFLRAAAHDLGRITGKVDVEDLLDVIFSEFCVGK